ncbi:histidinol dehydrogenase [Natronomonas pharaonis DSM 2160]|uniref:Histidinol dehydrogenase n=1 Tax=Natronomonas pharaonis (strain ATCC 35678 / DSM 2160 / CIP 103997 / JCM 8858 / NBRC 14720 / NCIMB 2260 / Gabara) TaxID=348780 RepID=HISX_NATPD|nr:histidinol dehydrogenase [Natronomonas pharaonis]Q3IQR5.1 RecName: Full=Histidinol dehydrogenase; Short=HDH [Natronomonas pharaonis DSM 2160]CAI49529.1 histidinol dehydrogenase [Natronomonas pharaonis DSM 2160]
MNVSAVADLSPEARAALFERDAGIEDARESVRDIIGRVREEGDVALRSYAKEFDDVDIGTLAVTDEAERAYDDLDDDLRDAIETAAENIRTFHERQVPDDWREQFDGRELGRRYRPLERVGVYAPGGTAAYPSSVLMGVIPAVVAGVDHVAVATPPAEELPAATLAAAHVAGADAVYQVGGAQAIAALAYGTESVSAVQKVVGPGNRWVTAAKAEVRGDVEIDFLAGPSELLVVCDDTADPELIAADMVAQAEHDPNASVVCVSDDEATAEAVADACERQATARERTEAIESALENDASAVLCARSMSEAVLFAEEYAAEHLSIVAADEEALLDRIDSAGSVFLGGFSPVAVGDYASGTNHVLPTGGLAKVAGGLSVDHFVRSTTVQKLDEDALSSLRETVTTLARAEGLEAHAESVDKRFD